MSTPTRPAAPVLNGARRAVLTRRVRWVVAITITWNVVEAVVAITAGRDASSTALVAFGLDSVVEVLSAAAVAWQFSAPDPQARERVAMRLIAVSFVGLALFVSVDALRTLLGTAEPKHSTIGIALAALSLAVMPFLSWFERRTGRELGSASAVVDSKQTLLCTYLSAVLLVGLLLNSTLGWTWADPIAALVIAAVALKEAREAWRGDACCAPTALTAHADDPAPVDGQVDPSPGAQPGVQGAGCEDGRCSVPTGSSRRGRPAPMSSPVPTPTPTATATATPGS
ncbi:cation transporter [Pseudokineococcus lusitanus]|uniref:Cation efflux family protein n=1 Tax=Pseudokineococcus lusitanus TaxID=763993 RepID=A0A3N1HSQ0_9ACTN|nr:cation transporter [Pseudokineococcus lusitanus]ROP45558.1 cation efflux family protein [Pseudokineococcus lusitanus]